jgi:hypothetical protein
VAQACELAGLLATTSLVGSYCSSVQVGFPLVLDAYDFCTPAYKKQLEGPRLAGQELCVASRHAALRFHQWQGRPRGRGSPWKPLFWRCKVRAV